MVMEVSFMKAKCDTKMLHSREFVIEEAGTQMAINMDQPWENCFFPGQRAIMNMVMK